jgi:pantoate--beta-alanine ligase
MIQVLSTVDAIRAAVTEARASGKTIALVPTMGALHDGHLTLVDLACDTADITVVSIFVNPTQFVAGEDFTRYPRDLSLDTTLLESRNVDIIFAPEPTEMYPEGFATAVTVAESTEGLCGKSRPGHFDGVATVVTKLFNIVRPDFAVFGQKDAQQLAVIRRLSHDLDLGVTILAAPIVREPDGLAMSSRNVYLTSEEREQAPVIHRALARARDLVFGGEIDAGIITAAVAGIISESPLAEIEYVTIVTADTIKPVNHVSAGDLCAVVVRFGKTRLIDNILF